MNDVSFSGNQRKVIADHCAVVNGDRLPPAGRQIEARDAGDGSKSDGIYEFRDLIVWRKAGMPRKVEAGNQIQRCAGRAAAQGKRILLRCINIQGTIFNQREIGANRNSVTVQLSP